MQLIGATWGLLLHCYSLLQLDTGSHLIHAHHFPNSVLVCPATCKFTIHMLLSKRRKLNHFKIDTCFPIRASLTINIVWKGLEIISCMLLGKLLLCLDLKHLNLKHMPFSFQLYVLSLKSEHTNLLQIHITVLKLFALIKMISTCTRNCLDTLNFCIL